MGEKKDQVHMIKMKYYAIWLAEPACKIIVADAIVARRDTFATALYEIAISH